MEIDINNIDLNDVPGYTPITKSTPVWKRDMIEKKNQEKIEEYIARKAKEKADEEKWKNVPAWKRKLMIEKEKEKQEKDNQDYQKEKEEHEKRKQKIKEQQEMERKMEEELKDVPAWKKEIMMKRGGAIKNWGDEREDINEQEMEERERRNNLENEKNNEQDSTYVQKTNIVLQKQAKNIQDEDKYDKPIKQKQIVHEDKLEDEWDSLPAWKKEIMMKRGGAIKNWGDEREEVNEED